MQYVMHYNHLYDLVFQYQLYLFLYYYESSIVMLLLLKLDLLVYQLYRNEIMMISDYYIFDYRISYQLNKTAKLSFIINNMFNREVMGRPMDIQAPRVYAFQLTVKF